MRVSSYTYLINAGNLLKARSQADSGPYIEKGLVLV
jgi:hypothetical protein